MDPAIPSAAKRIQEEPDKKLQEMRAGNGRNFVPDDGPGVLRAWNTSWSQCKALDALGIKMNLAMLLARQPFQQFGKSTLRAMPAIDEG